MITIFYRNSPRMNSSTYIDQFEEKIFYRLIKKFSAFGDRNGLSDRHEFTFYTIKNNEESFKYAGEVSES